MQFNDEPKPTADFKKRKKGMFTKLAYKLGAKNDAQANLMMIVVMVVGILATLFFYSDFLFGS